jgi:hypothetical protein
MTTTSTTTTTLDGPDATVPNRRGRTAWLAIGLVLAIAAIALGTYDVVGAFAFDRYSFVHPVPGRVTDLTVHNDAGSVGIEASARDGVSVVGHVTRGLNRPTEYEYVTDGHLVIDAHCPTINLSNFCELNLTIAVPRGLPMTVRASGGGITVDGATGVLDLSSSGGSVHVTGANAPMTLASSGGSVTAVDIRSATLDASSSGGSVHLSFSAPPTAVRATSSGGSVAIDVPDTPDAYAVRASSSGGSSEVGIRTSSTSSRTIVANSSGGSVDVRYPT